MKIRKAELLVIIVVALLMILFSVSNCHGQTQSDFLAALHQVETSGRIGTILGDNGKALGPYQIHKAYWQDSGITGVYADCADLNYSKRVVTAYMKRYAAKAWQDGDWETCARIHNGGPSGAHKRTTDAYWNKVKKQLDSIAKTN